MIQLKSDRDSIIQQGNFHHTSYCCTFYLFYKYNAMVQGVKTSTH